MGSVTVELDEPLAAVLAQLDRPLDAAVRELLVLELYRRAVISSGKAAELLGMPKEEFIKFSGRLGVPFFRMSDEQLDAEVERLRSP
jgi:predicted HTH domain antitoxin